MPAQLVLVAGAGGAGSSTVAARLATTAVAEGVDVVLADLDPVCGAASLLPPHGDRPRLVDLSARADRSSASLLRELVRLLGLDDRLVDEVGLLPGSDLVAMLLALRERASSAQLLVVDAGSRAVDLAAAAERMPWLAARVLPAQRGWLATSSPLVASALGRRWPGDRVARALTAAHEEAVAVRDLMSGAVAVLVESSPGDRRSLRHEVGLALHGVELRARVRGRAGSEDTEAVPLVPDGSRATEPLLDLVTAGPSRCAATITPDGEAWLWRIGLPLLRSRDVRVTRSDDDLVIEAVGVRRVARLPTALRRCRARRAVVRDGTLEVRFEPDEQEMS
ncbi:hypothetical protein PZ938_14180 [Luteipulveratus sp. YIM 133132]|uniref:hypothetical protein n=1 Tax=Luteipulveratus flavus TaxID=3031728 RepID=UPI0023B1133B|nr:hypothetical protein [Luteipulveratus sp. YIM 133132]MDE9366758.1 hypothetical protein [Luteipulveratus sp. YIM 133132]